MKRALTALEIIERFLDPLAKWQVRKPKDGGPMITVYPQKVAEEAINDLRQAVAKTKQRKWVGLTEEEIQNLGYLSEKFDASNSEWFDRWGFARAIEAKLKEKNT
jgi:hypothetical protein